MWIVWLNIVAALFNFAVVLADSTLLFNLFCGLVIICMAFLLDSDIKSESQ